MAALITHCTTHQVRLLIDPGSELSFISDALVKLYKLKRHHSSIAICGIGGSQATQTKGLTMISLKSNYSEDTIDIMAHILNQLTTVIPSTNAHHHQWPHITQLQLADPEFTTPRPIDIIIGADSYAQIIKEDIIKSTPGSPMAQLTIFGWIVLGPMEQYSSPAAHVCHSSAWTTTQHLEKLLTQFWVQEEIPEDHSHQLTPDEQACETHFMSTHTRDQSGRYIVRIPLKLSSQLLGNSFVIAQKCLNRLKIRLNKDSTYQQLYSSFMTEYETLGHMQRADTDSNMNQCDDDFGGFTDGMTSAHDTSVSGGWRVPLGGPLGQNHDHSVYYLPHHGVIKTDSTTTKLRVVFNGSSPSTSGYSLNDIQHTGAKLQRDLSDVLIWLRQFKYMFSSDITKMYRQVYIHPDDWDLQRILWVDEQGHSTAFQLKTVTYGTKSAPFLALRTVLQLVNDEGHRYPRAIPSLINGRYVDDIYGGSDQLEELITIAHEVNDLCMAGGFPLAKWQSNHPQFFTQFAPNSTNVDSIIIDDSSTKLLGLSWHPRSDVFKFNHHKQHSKPIPTKRLILSEVAQLFDPLGWLSPFTIRPKMLIQELWLTKVGWDEPVSTQLSAKWTTLKEELLNVSIISIPRWYSKTSSSIIEIHGFSDASQLAMAAVIYLRIIDPSGAIHTSLISAKSKVAPLKRLTIPRLELSAALILSKLVRYVQTTLNLTHVPTFLWTDSSVTLTWITAHPSRWKEYVRNRVSAIQDLVPCGIWKYVPGRQNPADCASHGLTISQLAVHDLWWTGPSWLLNSQHSWPNHVHSCDSSIQLEEQPGLLLNVTSTRPEYHWEMIYRFSSLIRLLRVTTICFRVLRRMKMMPHSSLVYPITPQDINHSTSFWIKATQAAFFSYEIKALNSGSSLPQTHPFNRLTAYIDTLGVIRVGGRLANAKLAQDTTHPSILPRDSHFTQLLIKHAHERTLHSGTQCTLNYLRQAYWILGGRAPVRSLILRCIKCARQRGVRAQQLMGQLPTSRVTPSRPFSVAGVDYAGPLTIRTWRGRGAKQTKGWLCVFVCFVTSAVHLEVATEYTSDSFIAAFRRFTGRRGGCHTLHSDCGKNFEGAAPQLIQLITKGTQENTHIFDTLTNHGTTWKFNPPAAPHMGGKWEAAVKSVKHHLARTIGDSTLTLEELNTLLIQIEAILNSRPLEPLSNDSEDLRALTPAHFLIGDTLTTIPEPSLLNMDQSRLKRWQFIQQRLQFFWNQWSTQYLQTQLARTKWHHPSNEIKVGTMVLLTDERLPPSKWPLARVTHLHPGHDGLTRVVTIKTATTSLKRPIAKLAVLPVTA